MPAPKKSLMRSLGEFAGHIIKGVRTPAEAERHQVRRDVEETVHNGMTLRRTIIEEVQLPDAESATAREHKDDSTCS